MELWCTCASAEVEACASASFQWKLGDHQQRTSKIQLVAAEQGKPAQLSYSAMTWSDESLLRGAECANDTSRVPLHVVLFNVSGNDQVVTKLEESYELFCTFRTNDRSVLSAVRLEWFRERPGSVSDGSQSSVDLNAEPVANSTRWMPVDFSRRISSKHDAALWYVRKDAVFSEPFQLASEFSTHYVLNSSLRISRVSKEDILAYRCVYTYEKEQDAGPIGAPNWTRTAYATATLFSKPFTSSDSSSSASQNVREGEPFVVDCDVFGLPTPAVVQWRVVDSSGNERVLFDRNSSIANGSSAELVLNSETVTNGRMQVTSAVYTQRGHYECVVDNEYGQTSYKRFVRIKSRYAFLYPLVGIVLEVVILFVIITVYKHRKAKSKKASDADDASGTGDVSDDEHHTINNGHDSLTQRHVA